MEADQSKQDKIISRIGLQRKVGGVTSGYNPNGYIHYVTDEYRKSERRENDEVYRMFEINLLHIGSGLRFTYMKTESYDGETVDYNLHSIFIITLSGEKHEISDVDFKKKIFYTSEKQIPFGKVSLEVE